MVPGDDRGAARACPEDLHGQDRPHAAGGRDGGLACSTCTATPVPIRAFITRAAGARGRAQQLGDDDDLIDSGVVDSLGIFQLVAFLEERFGIKIGDEEITPENFGTVAAIDRLVAPRSR